MAPQRPLSNLCLIAAFKMLPPNAQLTASQMSPRCAVLVRETNRTVKTLIIIEPYYLSNLSVLKARINYYSLASKPTMRPLMSLIPGKRPSFSDYPMTSTRFINKWHCLVIDSIGQSDAAAVATIEQITTVFSAVTDLKFITYAGGHFEHLVPGLLQHHTWQCQLTNLMVRGT